MSKFFSTLDRWIASIITFVVGVMMILLTLIVFMQVIARFVLKTSLGTIGESPVFLMILGVWLMSVILTRKDGHIKIEIIHLIFKNKHILNSIRLLVDIITLISIAIFTYLSFKYVWFGIETGDKAAGLKVPLWWITSVVLVSVFLMTIYYAKHLFTGVKGMRKWR